MSIEMQMMTGFALAALFGCFLIHAVRTGRIINFTANDYFDRSNRPIMFWFVVTNLALVVLFFVAVALGPIFSK
jgi:hypothetical protein